MLTAAAITLVFIGVAIVALLIWAVYENEDSLPKAPGALVFIAVLSLFAACISGGIALHRAYHQPDAVQIRICPVTTESP